MKYAFAAIAAAMIAAPALAQVPPATKDLFEERCGVCHTTGENSAPLNEALAKLDPAAIVEKLTTGTMASMAGGLSPQQLRELAVHLTGKGLPASGDLLEVKPAGR